MASIEILSTTSYIITHDYRLIENKGLSGIVNVRCHFSINRLSTSLYNKYREFESLSLYQDKYTAINTLTSKYHTYRLVTPDCFNHENFISSASLEIYKFSREKNEGYTRTVLTPEAVLLIIKGFDELDNSDKSLIVELEQTIIELKEENLNLKLLFKDLKNRINTSIKSVKK